MITRGLVILSILAVAACAYVQPVGLHSALRTPIPSIAVFEETPTDAIDLGDVHKSTCLNNFLDPRPGWERALDNLKVAAAQKGANAVSRVTYEDSTLFFCATGLKVAARALVATPASLEALQRATSPRKCEAEADNLSEFMSCKIRALPRS